MSIIRFISHAMFCFFLQISCSIELKSLDYKHVLYFQKALDARMLKMMFRRYIGNISVCGTDVKAIYIDYFGRTVDPINDIFLQCMYRVFF